MSLSLRQLVTRFGEMAKWDAQQFADYQRNALDNLLQHAVSHVPYYRETQAYQLGKKLDWKNWSQLPLLTRQTIQDQRSSLVSEFVPANHGASKDILTSGSTGRPIATLSTQLQGMIWDATTIREHLLHNRQFSGTLAAIRHCDPKIALAPTGIRRTDWGPPTTNIYPTGHATLLNINTPVEQQLDWLLKVDPHYLLTYPSNLHALAKLYSQQNLRLSNLLELRTISEAVDATLPSLCQSVFNVPLTDLYSAQELGYIALQIPATDRYRCQKESVFVEILDEHNQACHAGESGRVVITALHSYAMPLIRYDIGDIATVSEIDSVTGGVNQIARILGRVRNMLHLPTGEVIWPQMGIEKLLEIAPLRQIQIIQTALDRLTVRFACEQTLDTEVMQRLRVHLQKQLKYDFQIDLQQCASIARSASGKFEEFRSELNR